MRIHVVRQGDFLGSIAWSHGVSGDKIWNDPKNADLKKKRGDGNVLYPGDVVWVPDAPVTRFKLKVGSNNRFEAQVPMVKLKLAYGDDDGPWAGASYTVEGLIGMLPAGSTDGAGVASLEVPANASGFDVVFADKHRRFHVDLGHLDPVDETSGVRARLQHLGYLWPMAPGDEDPYVSGLRAFQREHGIDPTGELNADTVRALKDAHGS